MSRLSKERYAHASAYPNIPERMDEPIQDGIRRAFKIGRGLTEIEQIILQLELDAVRAERDALLKAAKWTVQFADANVGEQADGFEQLRDAIQAAKRGVKL